MIRLVRSILIDAQIIGLVAVQLSELDAQLLQVQCGHFFVQL